MEESQKSEKLPLGPFPAADPPEVRAALPPVGPAEALEKGRRGIGRFVEQDTVHIADVNAQFERARRNAERVSPAPEPVFHSPAFLRLQIGVMQLGHVLKAALVV